MCDNLRNIEKMKPASKKIVFEEENFEDDEEEEEESMNDEDEENEEEEEEENDKEEESKADPYKEQLKAELNKMSFEEIRNFQNKLGLKKFEFNLKFNI